MPETAATGAGAPKIGFVLGAVTGAVAGALAAFCNGEKGWLSGMAVIGTVPFVDGPAFVATAVGVGGASVDDAVAVAVVAVAVVDAGGTAVEDGVPSFPCCSFCRRSLRWDMCPGAATDAVVGVAAALSKPAVRVTTLRGVTGAASWRGVGGVVSSARWRSTRPAATTSAGI